MTPAWRTCKNLALTAGLVSLVCGAAALSLKPSPAESFPTADSSVEWQCASVAGFLTTCTKVRHIEPVLQRSEKYPLCLRRA